MLELISFFKPCLFLFDSPIKVDVDLPGDLEYLEQLSYIAKYIKLNVQSIIPDSENKDYQVNLNSVTERLEIDSKISLSVNICKKILHIFNNIFTFEYISSKDVEGFDI